MSVASKPYFKVLYDGKNITADISKHLLSLSYTDKTEGESDELEIQLEDVDRLWQNEWYPVKGSVIKAEIGMAGSAVLSCGSFMIDEIEFSAPPDIVCIKGLAAGIHSGIRTKKSYAHENKSLSEVIRTVASNAGFQVSGKIDNIRIARVMQHRETSLAFLRRLSLDYGYVFSVRDKTLVFTSIYDLEGRGKVLTLDRTDLISFSFRDKTVDTYKGAKSRYHNTLKNELVSHSEADDGGEQLEIRSKAENKQQAEAKAKAALHRANTHEKTGTIVTPGNVLLVAGQNIELTGLGVLSGKYHVTASHHTLDKSMAYGTEAELKRIGTVPESKHKSKKK